MTVTEIITALEAQQKMLSQVDGHDLPTSRVDTNEICRLSKWLALHVQQLEVDRDKHTKMIAQITLNSFE